MQEQPGIIGGAVLIGVLECLVFGALAFLVTDRVPLTCEVGPASRLFDEPVADVVGVDRIEL